MKVYPAIDLLNGKVVRFYKGRPNDAKVYSNDPVSTATGWARTGADGLHVVDLDATLEIGSNLSTVLQIITSVKIPVQVGGGIRTEQAAEQLIANGAAALVVGTSALTETSTFERIVRIADHSKIIIALDYADGHVLIKGWRELIESTVEQALLRFMEQGFHRFLLTCADRDGTMNGPDVETVRSVCHRYRKAEITAGGGVRSLSDLRALREAGAHVTVVGKALYESAFTISDVLREADD